MTATSIPPEAVVEQILRSRQGTVGPYNPELFRRKSEAEGGCGVIGIASSVPIEGRHVLQSLIQMRNRGNGKGGGAALAGLAPDDFGADEATIRDSYMVTLAFLDPSARRELEREHLAQDYDIQAAHDLSPRADIALDPPAPEVAIYYVRPRADRLSAFRQEHGLRDAPQHVVEDELVYQSSNRLNRNYYASLGEKRAFVLSHGKDLLVLKLVGYGEDVIHAYGLEERRAHVWIGHHRYPTKGTVWHPGGAHPFVGLHEALVHNGDFANYASVCTYLAQHNIHPQFLTDTEVSVLVFDLLHRTFGYPLEYVIEALAPTTERDFTMLPEAKRRLYAQIQSTHIHGSPDGPWFFLLAQSAPNGGGPREARLIGITDTSMLRPQVFALQQGEPGMPSVGFAASEKQAIDAALLSLSEADSRFWSRPDRYWNARGGSYTDGGAFIFSVRRHPSGEGELHCRDKFGRRIEIEESSLPDRSSQITFGETSDQPSPQGTTAEQFAEVTGRMHELSYREFGAILGQACGDLSHDRARRSALELLTLLLDRRYPTGGLRRSSILSQCDRALAYWVEQIKLNPTPGFAYHSTDTPAPSAANPGQAIVVDALGMPAEGPGSLALKLRGLVERGFRKLLVVNARGHRFIANGLGPTTSEVSIEVYGSSGDYLASGIDGATVVVHGSGQDQLAQIMKAGRLVVHGDVGQTFMYGAKGGHCYVLGNAAGRPLINAVGKPKVVINGTCLDYLAESFMAGDPLNGGGFVILNGVTYNDMGKLVDLETPYPGGNLFSLASGGALFIRDPHGRVSDDQLNGGRFAPFEAAHWAAIRPMLEENERLFGIAVDRLLSVDGAVQPPERIYRVIAASGHQALQPEQAWVSNSTLRTYG